MVGPVSLFGSLLVSAGALRFVVLPPLYHTPNFGHQNELALLWKLQFAGFFLELPVAAFIIYR